MTLAAITAYPDLYDQLVQATGTTPGRQLDEDLRQLHARHPVAFAARAAEIIGGYQAGRITSPWAFLRTAMQTIDRTRPITEQAGPEREGAIRQAEQLIHRVGHAITSHDELIATIFGPAALTADPDTLEQIADTLTPEQDAILGPTLRAQIAMTNRIGRLTIPGTKGPLHDHDTPQLRERMTNLWRTRQATLTAPGLNDGTSDDIEWTTR